MKVKIIFAWYDLWVGLFWNKEKRWLYIFLIPMIGIIIKLSSKKQLKEKYIIPTRYKKKQGGFTRQEVKNSKP